MWQEEANHYRSDISTMLLGLWGEQTDPFALSSRTVLMGMLIRDKVNLFVLYSLMTNYKLPCLPSPQARHLKKSQAIKVLKTVITVKYTTKIKPLHRIFFYAWFCSLRLLNHNSCLTVEQECLNWWHQGVRQACLGSLGCLIASLKKSSYC